MIYIFINELFILLNNRMKYLRFQKQFVNYFDCIYIINFGQDWMNFSNTNQHTLYKTTEMIFFRTLQANELKNRPTDGKIDYF